MKTSKEKLVDFINNMEYKYILKNYVYTDWVRCKHEQIPILKEIKKDIPEISIDEFGCKFRLIRLEFGHF